MEWRRVVEEKHKCMLARREKECSLVEEGRLERHARPPVHFSGRGGVTTIHLSLMGGPFGDRRVTGLPRATLVVGSAVEETRGFSGKEPDSHPSVRDCGVVGGG